MSTSWLDDWHGGAVSTPEGTAGGAVDGAASLADEQGRTGGQTRPADCGRSEEGVGARPGLSRRFPGRGGGPVARPLRYWAQWQERVLSFAAGAALASVVSWASGAWAKGEVASQRPTVQAANTALGSDPVPPTVMVDVKGDVRHPGVVAVPWDARVKDAITAAGGFLHPGDAGLLNLAAPLNDGDEVVVPAVQNANGPTAEEGSGSGGAKGGSAGTAADSAREGTPARAASGRVDLNTADAATLETIPGIGPAKAAAIVAYRSAHGPFRTVQDVGNVPGIGPVTLDRIAPYVVIVSGPSGP